MKTQFEQQFSDLISKKAFRLTIIVISFIFAFIATAKLTIGMNIFLWPLGIALFPWGLFEYYHTDVFDPFFDRLAEFHYVFGVAPYIIKLVMGWSLYFFIALPIIFSKNRYIYKIFYAILVIVLILNIHGCTRVMYGLRNMM